RPRVARTTGTTMARMMTAADAMRSRGTRQMVRSHSHAAPTSGMRERARQPAYNIVAEYVASTARATLRCRGRPALPGRRAKERAKGALRRLAGEQRLFEQAEALEERQARVEERSGEQDQHVRIEEPARRAAPAEERPHRGDQQQPPTGLGGEWDSRSRARQ